MQPPSRRATGASRELDTGLAAAAAARELHLVKLQEGLLRADRSQLEGAIERAIEFGAPICELSACRLAWAVAWHTLEPIGQNDSPAYNRVTRHLDALVRAPDRLLAFLSKRPALAPDAVTRLEGLAWSVACEQRLDWQPPECRRPENLATSLQAAARSAYERTVIEGRPMVAAYTARACRLPLARCQELADDAWANLFSTYWSPRATARCIGLSRPTTLACKAAVRLARRGKDRCESGDLRFLPDLVDVDPATDADRASLRRAYEHCRDRLPPRQAIIADLHLRRELRQMDVAEVLQIGRPAVNMALKAAMASLGECLKAKGFGPRGQEVADGA